MPEKGRQRVIQMLHQAHPGVSRMKSLARCYVWWPGIDGDLENCVKVCEACQVNQKTVTSLVLATEAMGACTYRLCRPVYGEDVSTSY